MKNFKYTSTVEAATKDQADQVMAERINHEEDYGFDYEIGYAEQEQYTAFVLTEHGGWFRPETTENAAEHRAHIMALEELLKDFDEGKDAEYNQIEREMASGNADSIKELVGDLSEEFAQADITYGVMERQ